MRTPSALLATAVAGMIALLAVWPAATGEARRAVQVLPGSESAGARDGLQFVLPQSSRSQVSPPSAREVGVAPAALAEESACATEDATHLVSIELIGPDEWRKDVPVEIVWSVDPLTRRATASRFRTDTDGRARCRTQGGARRPQWFWADLGFPTSGLSGTPIPVAGGEVLLPMVWPAWIDVEVVESDGPLTEEATVEMRSTAASAPGDRWHRYRPQGGRTRVMVEAGIELELRVSTPSGRTAVRSLRAPEESDASAPCRVELDGAGGVRIALRTFDGRPVLHQAVEVVRCDRWQPLSGVARTTDAAGELLIRLPKSFQALPYAELLLRADFDGAPHHAELLLARHAVRDGGRAEATLLPAPSLVAGLVVDPTGEGNRGTPVELQFGVLNDKAPVDGLQWQTFASAIAADDGTFQLAAFPPRGAPLRLRLPEVQTLTPLAVQPGTFDLRIEAPVRRTAFGTRRR